MRRGARAALTALAALVGVVGVAIAASLPVTVLSLGVVGVDGCDDACCAASNSLTFTLSFEGSVGGPVSTVPTALIDTERRGRAADASDGASEERARMNYDQKHAGQCRVSEN